MSTPNAAPLTPAPNAPKTYSPAPPVADKRATVAATFSNTAACSESKVNSTPGGGTAATTTLARAGASPAAKRAAASASDTPTSAVTVKGPSGSKKSDDDAPGLASSGKLKIHKRPSTLCEYGCERDDGSNDCVKTNGDAPPTTLAVAKGVSADAGLPVVKVSVGGEVKDSGGSAPAVSVTNIVASLDGARASSYKSAAAIVAVTVAADDGNATSPRKLRLNNGAMPTLIPLPTPTTVNSKPSRPVKSTSLRKASAPPAALNVAAVAVMCAVKLNSCAAAKVSGGKTMRAVTVAVPANCAESVATMENLCVNAPSSAVQSRQPKARTLNSPSLINVNLSCSASSINMAREYGGKPPAAENVCSTAPAAPIVIVCSPPGKRISLTAVTVTIAVAAGVSACSSSAVIVAVAVCLCDADNVKNAAVSETPSATFAAGRSSDTEYAPPTETKPPPKCKVANAAVCKPITGAKLATDNATDGGRTTANVNCAVAVP